MSDTLPILADPCHGCGACCVEQSSPPGYVLVLSPGYVDDPEGPYHEEYELALRLPDDLKAELIAYGDRLGADDAFAHARQDAPCLWLDRATGRCRHYEHRPPICRAFVVGSPGCHGWREAYGHPRLPIDAPDPEDEPDGPTGFRMTFAACVREAFAQRELVVEFDRLSGSNLRQRGTPLDLEIDRASGRLDADAERFVAFVRDAVWFRLPPEQRLGPPFTAEK